MQNPLFDSQDQGPGAPQILWQLQEMFSHGDSEQGSHPDQQPTAATGYEVAGATCTPCRSHTTHRLPFAQRKTFATVIKLEVMRLPDAYL